jgi:cysteinyl-tRNA synthetase
MPRPASRLSGVIQADSGIDLSIVFSGVRELAEEYGRHQSLLPIQLFKLHSTETSQQLKSMQDELRKIDKDLLRQYEQESKPEEANKLYRRLNMVLHKCSMKLAELRQRRSFEDDLGSDLRDDLEVKSKLRRMVELISKMSKNLDLDVEALPDRIESQRNVVSFKKPRSWPRPGRLTQL